MRTAPTATGARPPPDQQRTIGDVVLSQAGRLLSGPKGSTTLPAAVHAVAWRLLERPEALVSPARLIELLYPDPDLEPENAHVIVRSRIVQLRKALKAATAGRVVIRTETGVGYSFSEQRWRQGGCL